MKMATKVKTISPRLHAGVVEKDCSKGNISIDLAGDLEDVEDQNTAEVLPSAIEDDEELKGTKKIPKQDSLDVGNGISKFPNKDGDSTRVSELKGTEMFPNKDGGNVDGYPKFPKQDNHDIRVSALKGTTKVPNQDSQDSGTGASLPGSCESLEEVRRGSGNSYREVFDATHFANDSLKPLYSTTPRTDGLKVGEDSGNMSSSSASLTGDLDLLNPQTLSDWEDLIPAVVAAHNEDKATQEMSDCRRGAGAPEIFVIQEEDQHLPGPPAIHVGGLLGSSVDSSGRREFASGPFESDEGLLLGVPAKRNSKTRNFENKVEPFVMEDEAESNGGKKTVKRNEQNLLNGGSFQRQSSLENLGTLGLLMPVFPLVPEVKDTKTMSDKFKILQDDNCDLILAAAHIDDALKGRGTYGKARSIFKSKSIQRVFKMIDSRWYRWFIFLIIITHSILVLFEPTQEHILPGQMHPAVITLEVICVLTYIVDIALNLSFYSWGRFWRKEENFFLRAEFVLVCMFIVDLIMLVIEEIIAVRLAQPFRALRPFLLVCKAKNIAHMFEVSVSIAMSLGKALFVITGFLLVFSAIGVHLFMDDYSFISCNNTILHQQNSTECKQFEATYNGAFNHIGLAIIRLFVLLTTENYPDFMFPAFNDSPVNFIYFGVFLYAGVFFLTPILVAIIVDSYWKVAKLHVKKERKRERLELAKAWNIMDAFDEGALLINDKKFYTLFHIIRPELTEEEINVLIDYIDEDGDGEVDAFEWTTRLTDALQYTFAQERLEEKLLKVAARSKLREKLHNFLQSSLVSRGVIILVVIYQLLFFMRWVNISWAAELSVQILQSVIVTLFLVESILRIIANGRTVLVFSEIMDIILCFVAFISNMLWYLVPYAFTLSEGHNRHTYHGAVTVLSSLTVLCRFAFNSKAAKRFLLIGRQIAPVMFDLTVMVLLVLYFFAIIGLEIFYGWTIDGHTDADYASYGCGLGFQTFGCALLVLFQILTTSNWHEIMNDVNLYVHEAAALYFIPCFFILDMMIMKMKPVYPSHQLTSPGRPPREVTVGSDVEVVDSQKTALFAVCLVVAIAIEAFNKFVPTMQEEPKEKEEQSFGEKAKIKLNEMFASSREKPKLERRTSLAEKNLERWSNNPPSATGSRASITMARRLSVNDDMRQSDVERALNKTDEDIPSDTEVDSEEEDYAGLSIHERKERQFKRRLRKKKKKWKCYKVIAAYRKKSEEQINLHVGDEVKIIKKDGEMMKGKARGRTGWFPANYVAAIVRGVGKKGRKQPLSDGSGEEEVFADDAGSTKNLMNMSGQPVENAVPLTYTQADIDMVRQVINAEGNGLNSTYPQPTSPVPRQRRETLGVDPRQGAPHGAMVHRASSPQMQHPASPLMGPERPTTPKKKIMQSQGDWRRRILGDITVMNPDEMLELNRIVRTKIRDKKKESRQPRQVSLSVEMFDPVLSAPQEEIDGLRISMPTTDDRKISLASPEELEDAAVLAWPSAAEVNTGLNVVDKRLHVIAAEALSLREEVIQEEPGERSLTDMGVKSRPPNEIQILVEESKVEEECEPVSEPILGEQTGTGHHLSVAVKAPTGLKRNRPKSSNGEMPDWAKKLVATHNIQVSDDVKLPEETMEDPDVENGSPNMERIESDDSDAASMLDSEAASMLEKEITLLKEREMTLKGGKTVDQDDEECGAGSDVDKVEGKSADEKSDAEGGEDTETSKKHRRGRGNRKDRLAKLRN